jgi:hypothetical protein
MRFDNLDVTEQTRVTNACHAVERMSGQLVRGIGNSLFNSLRAKFFGTYSLHKVADKIRKMDALIRNPAITVTFVNRKGKVLNAVYGGIDVPPATVDPKNPSSLNIGGITTTTGTPRDTSLNGVYAFVFPAQRGGSGHATHHVGSGMRLYLADEYFTLSATDPNRPLTIYHELTHKTIGTDDHKYGSAGCQKLATIAPEKAGNNADSYAWFATEFVGLTRTVRL